MTSSCDSTALAQAKELLNEGELVAFHTETVYGLGANALDAIAVRKIFEAKGRPRDNPLIVHVASFEEAQKLTSLSEDDPRFDLFCSLATLWPGPLTIVVPAAPIFPEEVTCGLSTVGIRVPSSPVAQALLRSVGFPIAAPSANRSNYVSPTTADHVRSCLGKRVALILDGGPTEEGLESTIVSLAEKTPELLRPGTISLEELQALLPELTFRQKRLEPQAPIAPGMLKKHYSPQTPVVLRENADQLEPRRCACITFSSTPSDSPFATTIPLSESGNLKEVAQGLYASLRSLDTGDFDAIVIDSCESSSIGLAIMDRIARAAEGTA